MISIGMLVKVPRGTMVTAQQVPGPKRISFGRGSRAWQQWQRSRKQTESETVGVVIDIYSLGDGWWDQWATVLVDGQPLQMTADSAVEFTKPSVICPHCHKSGTGQSQMERWHFENCKWKRQ